MEDGFRARVERAFGTLASSQSSNSLWSLTGEEIEKREWNRDRDTSSRDEIPCSSSFDGFSVKDRKVFERKSKRVRPDFEDDGFEDVSDDDDNDDGEDFVSEIRSSVGLDSTLDNEEEEDEYDKVALGTENDGERLYMKDINNHGAYLNSHNVLPDSLHNVTEDAHANHSHLIPTLKEDESAASNSHPHEHSDKELRAKISEDSPKLKSILKRKENTESPKPRKRVRFDPSCKSDSDDVSMPIIRPIETTVSDDGSASDETTFTVPDYILNPFKYTRYSFDSSDETDTEMNTRACMDFIKWVKKSKATELNLELDNASVELPKSITFVPKKKTSDSNGSEVKVPLSRAGVPVGIAVGEGQCCEGGGLEDEETESTTVAVKGSGLLKPARQYRSKSGLEDS